MILKAQEENKLNLDEPIIKYLPSIKNAAKITIRNLLNHRSGIHNFTKDHSFLTYRYKEKTKKEMLVILENLGSDFEPDSMASYSSSNYVLLSYILEDVYKKKFSKILNEKIVNPLELLIWGEKSI